MKRILCVICAVVLLCSLAACGAKNQPADGTEQAQLISGTFHYCPVFSSEPVEETFYYSDEYFAADGRTFNASLMTTSFELVLAASQRRSSQYVTEFLTAIGFGDISAEDMAATPTTDSLGSVIARKKVGDHNVIAVILRGYEYDSEWASNFTVGATGDAKGFSESRQKLLQRLQTYLADRALTNNKIWMAGYSRSGAVVNLAGVSLNGALAEYSTTASDLYIYAFAPPAACADDTVYDNIHILTNAADVVPYVCPAEWGLHINGTVTVVGENPTIKTYTNILSPAEYQETDAKAFLTEFIHWLAGRLTREEYAEKLEKPLTDLIALYFGKTEAEQDRLIAYVKNLAGSLSDDIMLKMRLAVLFVQAMKRKSDSVCDSVSDLIAEYLKPSAENDLLTAEEYATVVSSLRGAVRVLLPLLVDDINYFDGIDYEAYYAAYRPNYNLSDTDFGHLRGSENGFNNGYSAGFSRQTYADELQDVQYPGEEFLAGYTEGYREAYRQGFDLGTAHADDLAARGTYDGTKRGESDGYYAGKEGSEFTPTDGYFTRETWMTDDYVAAYDLAYAAAYEAKYEAGRESAATTPKEPQVTGGYHFASLIPNVLLFGKNHYPQVYIEYFKAMDNHYQ